jgi:hypothetical protein
MSSNTMLAVPVKNAIASLDLKQAVTSYLASNFSRETAAQAAPSLSEAQARGISAPGHACMQHQHSALGTNKINTQCPSRVLRRRCGIAPSSSAGRRMSCETT